METARIKAADRGDRIYHDGGPCPHGHNDGRYTRTGRCITCDKNRALAYQRSIAERLDRALSA